MSLAEFFDYLIAHDASRGLGLSLAETYTERDRSTTPQDLAHTA